MTISSVTVGEFIEPAWGNSVANRLNGHDVVCVRDASISIPTTTNVAVNGFSDTWNPGGWTTTSSGITVPEDGVYLCALAVDWSSMTTNTRTVQIINGPNGQVDQSSDTTTPNITVVDIAPLSASQVVSVTLWQGSGSTVTAQVRLSVARLG